MKKPAKVEKPAATKRRFYRKASGSILDSKTKLEWMLGPDHPVISSQINTDKVVASPLGAKYTLPNEEQVKEINGAIFKIFSNNIQTEQTKSLDTWLGRKIIVTGKKYMIFGDPETSAVKITKKTTDLYVIGVKAALKNGEAFTVSPTCGSITDNDTGYVWYRAPKNSAGDTNMNWQTAKDFAEGNDPCSSQWTLPSAAALEGLNDNIIAAQAVSPGTTPFDDWTGTTTKKCWSAYKVLNYAKAISLGDEGGTINYPVTSTTNFRVIGIRIG